MNTIIWLFAGGFTGWLASNIVGGRSAHLLNILVGMVGAFVTGYLFIPVFLGSPVDQGIFSLPGLIIALGGAIVLLGIVNFLRKENTVKNVTIEHRWALVRSKIHTRWNKLSEEDVALIDGNLNRFVTTLEARYGCARQEAEDQIRRYLKSVLVGR